VQHLQSTSYFHGQRGPQSSAINYPSVVWHTFTLFSKSCTSDGDQLWLLLPVVTMPHNTHRYINSTHMLCAIVHAVSKGKKGKGNCIAVMEHHVTATECRLPYGITQCYLLPDTSERTLPSPQPVRINASVGTRFTYPGGIQGWVDLGDCYIRRWFTRPQAATHPSTNQAQCRLTSLIKPMSQVITIKCQKTNRQIPLYSKIYNKYRQTPFLN